MKLGQAPRIDGSLVAYFTSHRSRLWELYISVCVTLRHTYYKLLTFKTVTWNTCQKDTAVYWALFQYPIRRLTVTSRKVFKPWDLFLELCTCPEVWQAPRQQSPRQHCCWGACRISKRSDYLNCQSRSLDTSLDLTIRRLIGYWNGALISVIDLEL